VQGALRPESERETGRVDGLAQMPCQAGREAEGGKLSMFDDVAWLADYLGDAAVPAGGGLVGEPGPPAIILSFPDFWTPVREALRAIAPSASHSQHFGVLFGEAGPEGALEGALRVSSAELCPTAFVWEPSVLPAAQHVGTSVTSLVGRFASDLEVALDAFLSGTFRTWATRCAADRGSNCVAWLACNNGEAYSVSKPMVDFGHTPGEGCGDAAPRVEWRSTLVVIDALKSSPEDVAMDAFSLRAAEPRRLVFDFQCGS